MKTANLLVELHTEELPPKALCRLSKYFATSIVETLVFHRVADEKASYQVFASPRRLGVLIREVRSHASTEPVTDKLVPEKVAYDSAGKASAALIKKLAKLIPAEPGSEQFEVALSQVQIRDGFTYFVANREGKSLTAALSSALKVMVDGFPSPKRMTYQLSDGITTVQFVRPAHGLVALHGNDVVEGASVLGLEAGRTTQGHRFEAAAPMVTIKEADAYEATLQNDGSVIASFAARRAEIVRQLADAAARVGGGARPIADEDLLDEVTALVERPNVLVCAFEQDFLEVPQECLILTMKANQKYFPLLDAQGKLTNRFLVVSNIRPDDASAVIGGNERVVRPRLADAKFFFDQDRKKTLASRVPQLAKVVYHNKLGTQGERTGRVRQLSQSIARVLSAKGVGDAFDGNADNAAMLAKADLLTDMVGEFPELQGTMGRYYALNDKLPQDVADAIEDHYKPRFSGDELPRGTTGLIVALADKLETLVGMFATGNVPSGDKDPFALRRHALGILRILLERDLHLDIKQLIEMAFNVLDDEMLQRATWDAQQDVEEATKLKNAKGALVVHASSFSKRVLDDGTVSKVLAFVYDRLSGQLRDQGYSAQEVDAVVAVGPQRLGDIPKRLAAVRAFAALPEAPALAAANKRISNILKKAEKADAHVSEGLLKEPAEQALYAAMKDIAPRAGAQFDAGDYTASLQTLAALRGPVDAFFDDVMVNAEEPDLRLNRLGLLATLHQAMNRVADLSRLAT